MVKDEKNQQATPVDTVPEQVTGDQTDNVHEHTASSSYEADKLYSLAVDRLLNVNQWGDVAGLVSATFRLTDTEGVLAKRNVWENDYIRIDIPGPGTEAGDGYDWVKVERIDESEDHESDTAYVSLTVRPASNPTNEKDETAHFFDDEATSTFIVRKDRNRVIAEIHGRNERPNNSSASKMDKLRNKVVAGSARTVFSNIQWSNLAKGFVHPA